MRSKGFVSAFFIATTSGHSVQKWKGKGNEQKRCEEIIACCYCCGNCGKNSKRHYESEKAEENIPADIFEDFYEEEMNWWDKDLEEREEQ